MADKKPFIDFDQIKIVGVACLLIFGGQKGVDYLLGNNQITAATTSYSPPSEYDLKIMDKVSALETTVAVMRTSQDQNFANITEKLDHLGNKHRLASNYEKTDNMKLAKQ